MSTFWAMSIAHSFMSIFIHRAGFMSIARYEFYDNIGSMYELCSYYDSGFIMDELCSYISCMTFIMIPMAKLDSSSEGFSLLGVSSSTSELASSRTDNP